MDKSQETGFARTVLGLGGHHADLALVKSSDGPLSASAIETWAARRTRIFVLDVSTALGDARDDLFIPTFPDYEIAEDVLDIVDVSIRPRERSSLRGGKPGTIIDIVRRAVARAWGIEPSDLFEADVTTSTDVQVHDVEWVELPGTEWSRSMQTTLDVS